MTTEDINNRFSYHPPDSDQIPKYANIRLGLCQAATMINLLCPEGREKALAITKLEEAMFFANAAIARAPRDS